MFKIGVCGLGKLGAPIAAVMASCGVTVTAFDTDRAKVDALQKRMAPVLEPELDRLLLADSTSQNLRATHDVSQLVRDSNACIFVLPTPSLPSGDFDHRILQDGMQAVMLEAVKQLKRSYVLIVTSTVMPGYLGKLKESLARSKMDFKIAYKPEFIALGTVIQDLRYPDVTLIGTDDGTTGNYVEGLFRQIAPGSNVKRMSVLEAEIAKISLNCAVTTKISFANQIGLIARKFGVSAETILDAVGADRRIGPLCLRPGLPWGGPCFPRDGRMLSRVAERVGIDSVLTKASDAINQKMYADILARIPTFGAVGILGLAYKRGTAVTEESVGTWLIEKLHARGASVRCHDAMAEHPNSVEEVLACPTVVICCDWPLYRNLTFRPGTLVVDPFNVCEKKESAEFCEAAREAVR